MRNLDVATSVQPIPSKEPSTLEGEDDTLCAFTEEELALARQQPDKAVITRPPMLGYASVVLIIVNRMIGTGIFRTPTTLVHGTHSIAYSLMFWAAGGVVAVSGSHVFAEFGLTIPRVDVEHEGEQFVPRNGGEKNYIEYVLKKPKFLATCIYGIPFVIFGSVAGNALVFATCILEANGNQASDWAIRGVAIGVTAFACLLHATWRKGGVYLNNFFGAIKAAILLAIFALGVAYVAGQFGGSNTTASDNLSVHRSNKNARSSPYGYAEAFLAVLFAFGGFNQASYVLGEVENPRKRFKSTTISTVACISVLYFLVNLAYMFVVPSEKQIEAGTDTVAYYFFVTIFGQRHATKIQDSLMAFSALGNIIVQTFTAARVKQEIAKEGVLPFAKFFAKNYSLTPKWLRSKSSRGSEDTPVGAFGLHLVFAVILILASAPAKDDSYRILVNVYSFTIDAVFGVLVGLSLLVLRMDRSTGWSKMSSSNHWISITTAAIFTIANLFPLVAVWIPPSASDADLALTGKWFEIGTIGMGALGLALLYWIALYYLLPTVSGLQLEVDREYNFIRDRGHWIMWHEVVSFKWKSV